MKALRSSLAALVLVAVCLALSPGLGAHMKFEKSEPAADSVVTAPQPHVQLFFGEEPDIKVSKLEIKGPSEKTKLVQTHVMGKSLMAMVEGGMPDGVYTVSWQAAGDDGHIQKGDFSFTVKRK